MADTELSEVYSAADNHEAHLIKVALEEIGIEAQVVGDHLQNAVGDLPAMAIAPRIWVHTSQAAKARTIIADLQNQRRSDTASRQQWKCAKCGEANEATFEICWNCQTAYVSG